jgi:hypothetical protein
LLATARAEKSKLADWLERTTALASCRQTEPA